VLERGHEQRLGNEAANLVGEVEAADESENSHGMSIPSELGRRELRLRKPAQAEATTTRIKAPIPSTSSS
jgi:hypothetical protein